MRSVVVVVVLPFAKLVIEQMDIVGDAGVSSWTVVGVNDKGAKATYSGNTIRILESQSDGTWRTKVHMYASDR
jgi:hypothetical protein